MKKRSRMSVIVLIEEPTSPYRMVQELKLKPGHRVWELNQREKVIREAVVKYRTVNIVRHVEEWRVPMREDCNYCCALHQATADIQFLKMLITYRTLNPV